MAAEGGSSHFVVDGHEAQTEKAQQDVQNERLVDANRRLEETNRELTGLNEELETLNDDLQARRAEPQESARGREEERRMAEAAGQRLEAILRGVGDPVLAVGPDERVLFSNDPFTLTFGGDEQNRGPTLGNFLVLDEAGERVSKEATPQVRAGRRESEALRRFEARGRPENLGEA